MRHKDVPKKNLLLLCKYNNLGANMAKEKRTEQFSVKITKTMYNFLEDLAKSKNVKFMPSRELYELAELGMQTILDESKEYKERIESAVKKHKEQKVEKALMLIEALEKDGKVMDIHKKGESHDT